MKSTALCLFALSVIAYVCARPEKYTTKYDNIDVDQILRNDRLLKRYVDCVMDRGNGRCPPEAIELRRVISDALETECEKCSEQQVTMIRKVIKYLIQNKSGIWEELKAKYDPDGKYAKQYEDLAKTENVQI